MKKLLAGFLCIAWVAILTGTACPSGDQSSPAGAGTGSMGAALKSGAGTFVAPPAGACIDLVYSETFQARKLEYVDSMEFADSMQSVANGRSVYSPQEIPAEWPAIAAEWRKYLSTRGKGGAGLPSAGMFPNSRESSDADPYLAKEACAPALVYLASLEFRSRSGRADITPVFPRLVRAGIADLGSVTAAKKRMEPFYAKRAAYITAKLATAEEMGAKVCQPQELDRARKELDRARGAASSVRDDVKVTDALFDKADEAADSILASRRYAMQRGVMCIKE